MGVDHFGDQRGNLHAPAWGAAAVTPHDTNELPIYSRQLYIGGAGNVEVVMVSGETVIFPSVPAGTELAIRCKIVKASGTSATDIVAMY